MDTRRCSLPFLSMPLLDTPCSDMYEYATPLLDRDSITSVDVTSSSPTPSSVTSSAPPVVCCDNRQLDVIVHRDGSGYGFSISGDTPVSICHVKPDGPAIRAGVCLRDRIVKVNGRHVTGLTHTEVVDHIASSSSVLLTLERSPKDATTTQQQHTPSHSANIPGSPFSSVVTPVPAASVSRASVLTPPPTGSSAMSLDSRSMANRPLPALPASEPLPKVDKKVTAPLPADDVARRHWDTKTTHTIRLMLEEQERHLDKLRAQLAVLGTTAAAAGSGQLSAARIRQHVLSAESRRDQLMAKLRQAAAVDNEDAGVDGGVAAGAVLPSSSSKSTPNCSSVPPVPLARASLTPSAVPVVSPSSSATRSSSPPPLPQRNRSFPTAIPASVPIPATRSRLPLPLPNAYSSSSNIGPLHPLPVTSVSSTDQSSTEKLNTYSTTPTSSKTTPTTFKTTSPYSKASLTVALNSPHAALLPPRKTPLLTSTPTSGVQTPPALPPRTYRQQSLTDDNTAASEVFPTRTGMSALSALSHSTTSLLGNRVLTALSSEVTNSASTTTNSSSTCCDDNGAAERIASDTSTSVLSTAGSDGDLAKQRRDSHGPRRLSEFGSLSELSTAAAAGGTSAVISTRADMSSSCRAAQPYSQRRDSYTPNKNNESGSCRMSSTSPTRSSGPLRTPPGTPPPPYVDIDSPTGTSPVCRSISVITAQTPTAIPARRSNSQVPFDDTSNAFKPACSSSMKPVAAPAPVIMTIEDDDLSEQETSQEDCHGAFSSVREVMSRHAHLAVFMNFVISNCNPSSLFFYMITSLYESGSPKEMRRWAYEIYSSFLLQGATMLVPNITETILSRISSTLQNESDRADKLKSVFARARREALSEVSRQLAEFRCKRTAGLGSMFGPLDQRLDECYQEKGGKMRVVEDVLVRKLETIQNSVGDWDGADLRDSPAQWLLCCLSTVLYRHFGSRSVQVLTAVDLLPMFVGKERSLKHKLLTKYKKTAVGLGHHLQSHQYNDIAYCTVCNDLIRGVSPQALQCSHCEMNVHRYCLSAVDEQCVGRRSNDKISKFIGRIRNEPRRRNLPASPSTTSCSSSTVNHLQGSPIDVQHCESNGSGDGAGASGAREQRRVSDVALVTGSGDCRSHGGHGGEVDGSWESGHAGKLLKVESEDRAAMSSATTGSDRKSTIGRSESCRQERERFSRKKIIRERRKHSDPNIPAKDDEDEVTERLCTNTQSGSSSNSSLSTRFESPSTSMDSVLVCSASSGRQVATSGSSSAAAAAAAAAAAVFGEGCDGWDSDLEAEADPPRWEAFVPVVSARGSRKWTPADRKRLDVVNELFHTERTHVRNLKVLVRVFYRPLLDANILHSSDLHLLFGNVEELLKLHSQFNESMKERLRQRRLNESVGDILVSMFEGENGVNFRTAAAAFCRSQSLALSKLKTLRKRDSNLMTFLAGAESNPVCRRLQLKDILPTAMQRLTKYPLLLASLLKTVKADDERVLVQRAYDSSCQILAHVNKVKGDTERHERLVEIQSKLDQISFCRTDHPAVEQIGGRLDLTKYRLIHEGSVQFKFSSKSKHLELYMLLLEERFLVLLQRQQEDKYSLKFHTVNNNEMNPIIRTSSILVRENAAEKRAIIIINMVSTGPQYYELLFSTSNERDTWYQLIKNAADKDSVASGVSAKPIGRSHKRTESAHSILSAPSSDDNSQPQQQLQQHHLSSKGSPSPRPKSTAVFPAPPEENSTESGSEPGSSTSPGVVDTVNSETSSKAIDHHKPQQQQQQTQHQQQQKFEFIEASSLIDPSEVVVSCSVVHSAHSVVTPLERVRRADEQIRKALRQKQSVLDELITQQQPESTCSNNNIDSGCGDDDEEVPTQRLVLQAAVNVNSCVALIVGAMSKSQQSVSDTSTAETNSCSNSSSSNTSPSDSSCIQCVDVRESTVPTLEQLLQMQQQLADTLTQLLVSVERQQSERQQLRQLLERVHLLERQLSETASAQQSQQRQQTSMKEEEESSTMAVVDESAPQHNNSDSESLVEDKEQIDGAGVVECQQQQQANVEQIDGAGVVENQLQRQTNVKHIDGLDDHQQQQKAEVEQVDCSTAVECMEQQQQQQTGVLDVCSSPLPSQLETPAGEGSVLDDCTTGPTLLDTSGEEGVDDAVSLSKESCDTLCQQDQEHDESRDSSSSYDDASTLTTREKNELSAVDLQSSETTEPLVDTDPAPSSTTESPVSSSSQEISHTT